MTDLRKAAEMALEALMQKGEHHPKVYQAAEALRQALAHEALDRMVAENERLGLYDDQPNLVYRLRKRAEIRRKIPDRKSVQEGKPDRIADLLEEAADYIEKLKEKNSA